MPKLTTFAAYGGIFTLIISIVAVGYRQPQPGSIANANVSQSVTTPTNTTVDQPSVDELVATDVAANLAERTNMSVAANVAELSVSLSAKTELAQVNETVISKPQIVQPTASSRDISTYKTLAGDTVQSVAAAYNISAETVKWANNLTSDALEAGRDLTIPPIDGVVYTIKADDTPDKVASKYKADKERIVAYNDLELDGFAAGKRIVIPAGVLPEDQRPGYRAPAPTIRGGSTSGSTSGGGYTISRGLAGVSSGNAYAFGNCTYYAFERRQQLGRPVGSFWGNASTWAMNARAAGFTVNNTPAPGAIMQNGGGFNGYGHVAIVEEVLSNGDVRISEMNYYGGGGGFNIVSGRTVSAGQAKSYNYIH